jgi:hypothetical protein
MRSLINIVCIETTRKRWLFTTKHQRTGLTISKRSVKTVTRVEEETPVVIMRATVENRIENAEKILVGGVVLVIGGYIVKKVADSQPASTPDNGVVDVVHTSPQPDKITRTLKKKKKHKFI